MKEYDLEDLAVILSCALDNMEIVCDRLEDSCENIGAKDAMHSVYIHLHCLSAEITDRVNRLPLELIRGQVAKV